MSANVWKLVVVLAGIATAVFSADLFMAAPGNQAAARAVMMVGIVVFLFSFALALAGLIAGALRGLHRWHDDHEQSAGRRIAAH